MSKNSATADGGSSKGGRRWMIVAAVVVALGAAVGAAVQFLVRPGQAAAPDGEASARARAANPVFVALDQFTVNLADEGGERFAQIAVTLQVSDEKVDKAIRAHMPSIRNAILLLISSMKAGDLLSLDGKKALSDGIALRAGAELGWPGPGESGAPGNPIVAVHYSNFIVQ